MGRYLKNSLFCLFLGSCIAIMYYFGWHLPELDRQELINKVNSENIILSEKCGKAADAYFEKEWHEIGNPLDAGGSRNYTSHYNERLSKCLIYVQGVIINNGSYFYDELHEVFGRKVLGEYRNFVPLDKADDQVKPASCRMLDKYCTSQNQFDAFVKNYME